MIKWGIGKTAGMSHHPSLAAAKIPDMGHRSKTRLVSIRILHRRTTGHLSRDRMIISSIRMVMASMIECSDRQRLSKRKILTANVNLNGLRNANQMEKKAAARNIKNVHDKIA